MAEQVITAEAGTLEEARAQLSAMIPQGSFVVSERVLCDGRPHYFESQDVTIEATTLDEARQQIRAKTPAGREVTREYELYSGRQGALRATAYDDRDALRCARDQAPPDAEIVAERIPVHAINKKVTVSAFSQGEAQRLALTQSEGAPEARWPTVLSEPRKGFLGLGRKPGTYSVDLSFSTPMGSTSGSAEVAFDSYRRIFTYRLSEKLPWASGRSCSGRRTRKTPARSTSVSPSSAPDASKIIASARHANRSHPRKRNRGKFDLPDLDQWSLVGPGSNPPLLAPIG